MKKAAFILTVVIEVNLTIFIISPQRLASAWLPAASMSCVTESFQAAVAFVTCHCTLFILAFIFLMSSVLAFSYHLSFISEARLEVEALTWRTQMKVLALPTVQQG